MALKVAGTEVVDNSRGLKNITSVDATTAAAITAAGVGGGGTYDFVASGAIASGDVVVLNTDGTVSVAAETPPYSGTPAVFESAGVSFNSSVFDSNSNTVVIAYRDAGNSGYGTAVVGTVSGTSITFGTPVVFESAGTDNISATFDSINNKVVIAYRDSGNSNYGTSVVGTVSGTSITFGTPVVFESANTFYTSTTFDSTNNKVVISYADNGNLNSMTAIVGTVSGTSISFGTAAVVGGNFSIYTSATFDSNSSKVVIAYQDQGNSNYGTAVVCTVSGTSISGGTPVVFETADTAYISCAFDSNANKVIIAYKDLGNSAYGTAIVGTVSGTSISFGSPVVFQSARSDYISAAFDSINNKVVIAYQNFGNSSYGTAAVGTVSGTSISFISPVAFNSVYTTENSITFDSTNNKLVIAYRDGNNSGYGTGVAFDAATGTNAGNWIGISTEAISDTATGTVTIPGGVNEQQSGLTTGSVYYIADDGSLTTSTASGRKIGKAISTTKLLITEGNA